MENFNVVIKPSDDDSITISIRGEFIGNEALDYQEEFVREIRLAPKKIIFLLQDVPYIDSAALGVLMKCSQKALDYKKQMIISRPSAKVLKILQLTKLDKALSIEQAK